MSINEMDSRVKELRELRRMADELAAEIESITDSIKADMINALDRLPGEDIEPKHLGSQRPLEAIMADLRSIYLQQ